MRAILFAGLLVAGIFNAVPAFAHAHLREATPAADSTVAAPTQVSISFSEAVEPKFSTVVVTDAAGTRVDANDLHIVDGNAKVVAIGLKPVKAGVYTVDWHATSVDTHKTEGKFSFTVAK
jgi:methionine-rich copper-binding protein CopC